MKKLLVIFMAAVLCLSLCACNSGNNTNSAETTELNDGRIELTLDNYEQYLDVDGWAAVNFDDDNILDVSGSVKGVSDNFNYYDVTVTLTIRGKYNLSSYIRYIGGKIDSVHPEQTKTFGRGLEITNVNISGNGSAGIEIENLRSIVRGSIEVDFEVKSVSGYVVPAK